VFYIVSALNPMVDLSNGLMLNVWIFKAISLLLRLPVPTLEVSDLNFDLGVSASHWNQNLNIVQNA
jgi:hypothetical protein